MVEPSVGYTYHVRTGSISRVLELHHVEAMLAADATFLRDHAARRGAHDAAQARRTRSLEEAASFLTLVQHLKDRAPLKAVGAALRDPVALRHLRMPIAAQAAAASPAPSTRGHSNDRPGDRRSNLNWAGRLDLNRMMR